MEPHQAVYERPELISLQFDNKACYYVIGDLATIPVGSWSWVDYLDGLKNASLYVNLTAGSHALTYYGTESQCAARPGTTGR